MSSASSPAVVLIGGYTSSGKTTLATAIHKSLNLKSKLIHLDEYTKLIPALASPSKPSITWKNWECVETIDFQRLLAAVRQQQENYSSDPIIILEGFLIHNDPSGHLTAASTARILLDCDELTCKSRRAARGTDKNPAVYVQGLNASSPAASGSAAALAASLSLSSLDFASHPEGEFLSQPSPSPKDTFAPFFDLYWDEVAWPEAQKNHPCKNGTAFDGLLLNGTELQDVLLQKSLDYLKEKIPSLL